MIKILSLTIGLLLAGGALSQSLQEKIKQMRLNFEQGQIRNNTINRLQAEQKMIDAYVAIVAARRQCDKLGIDCQTGEAKESVQSKVLELEQERLLIDAYMSTSRKRKHCKQSLVDCKTGLNIAPKVVVRNVSIPIKPRLSGYFNDKALFFGKNNEIKQYSEGDMVLNGYRIKKIYPNKKVILTYKKKDYPVE
jgi:hypothetical protein